MLEIRAQLRVADLDRKHRVLQRREHPVGVADRRDGAVEEALDALRRAPATAGVNVRAATP